jgi:Spy/CpxP family protein refolding chaperone
MGKLCLLFLALFTWVVSATLAQSQPDLNSLARRIADQLQLSETTTQALQEAFRRHADHYEQGGFFWYVAAELQRKLNDKQRAEFWQAPLRAARNYPEHRMRRERLHRQDKRPSSRQAALRIREGAHLADYLNLSEAQRDSLAVLRRRQNDALRELFRQWRVGTLSNEAFRAQAQQLREQYRTRFRQLLTPKQQQQLDRLEAMPETSQKAMLEVLRLTSEQQQQLAALALQPGPKQLALEHILTPEQQEIVRLHHRLVRAWQAVSPKD